MLSMGHARIFHWLVLQIRASMVRWYTKRAIIVKAQRGIDQQTPILFGSTQRTPSDRSASIYFQSTRLVANESVPMETQADLFQFKRRHIKKHGFHRHRPTEGKDSKRQKQLYLEAAHIRRPRS